ncbi:DnaJ domain-containing protein [Gehongia tenuis]|uniref:DnaJ domain-containing protein n=1 Tax=Gehongia tenuis TaxID=2763655 RepID=A0A926D438_9FIRM|nr:DnaJ domain-containing protein [Gehongia tenuis]MBC8531383.1 DnaJ domain-containing protein [Gehongia tenuis]
MNPYDVLGLENGASLEDIKAAYRRLAKRYHPDLVPKAEKTIAEERLKSVNLAYEALVQERGRTKADSGFEEVQRLLDRSEDGAALAMLNAMTGRSGKWHYYRGLIEARQGRFDEARNYLELAAKMDPDPMILAERNRICTLQEALKRKKRGLWSWIRGLFQRSR